MNVHEKWQAEMNDAYVEAFQAGRDAIPAPMVVGTPKNVAASLMGGDDGGFDEEQPVYFVSEGACGFASVRLYAERGGESRKFVNWLSGKTKSEFPVVPGAEAKAPGYNCTAYIWVGDHGQSMARKEAHARVLAQRIMDLDIEGLKAYPESRMD